MLLALLFGVSETSPMQVVQVFSHAGQPSCCLLAVARLHCLPCLATQHLKCCTAFTGVCLTEGGLLKVGSQDP